MCKISIIVPIYNREKTISRCIDSILNQTFVDFELLLIDDGSTDNSLNICKSYKSIDSRIKIFTQSNSGPSAARNLGLRHSKGKYIMFCDSDDTVSVDWCKNLYNAISNNPNSLPFSAIITLDNNSNIINKTTYAKSSCIIPIKNFFNVDLKGLSGFNVNKIFINEILQKNNIQFDESLFMNEDLKFILNYVKFVDNLFYINTLDYNYYVNPNSLSKSYNNKIFDKWNGKYEYWKDFFKSTDKQSYSKNLKTCCDQFLYLFITSLSNTFDKRNTMSFKDKYLYNKSIVKNSNFQECIKIADCSKENYIYIILLKSKIYFLVFLFDSICKIKSTIIKH